MKQWLLGALGVLMLFVSTEAVACPTSYNPAWLVTTGQQLDSGERAVLTVPMTCVNRFQFVDYLRRSQLADAEAALKSLP